MKGLHMKGLYIMGFIILMLLLFIDCISIYENFVYEKFIPVTVKEAKDMVDNIDSLLKVMIVPKEDTISNLSEAESIASELKDSLILSEETSKDNIVKAKKNMKDRKNIINHEREVMRDNIFIDGTTLLPQIRSGSLVTASNMSCGRGTYLSGISIGVDVNHKIQTNFACS